MRFLMWGRSVGLKKKILKKKSQEVSDKSPWYPSKTLKVNIHLQLYLDEQNAQYTVKSVPVFVPVFLYAVTKLIFQVKRIISREKWFN